MPATFTSGALPHESATAAASGHREAAAGGPGRWAVSGLCALLGLGLVLTSVAGCTQTRVASVPSREVIALGPDDTARILKLAGFTDAQVISAGPGVRNSLATTGGAQVWIKGKVEAIFAVEGRRIHVVTRQRGNFIYDVDSDTAR